MAPTTECENLTANFDCENKKVSHEIPSSLFMLAIVITLRYELYWQMDACGGSTSMMQHWNVPLFNFLPIDPKL